MTWMLRFGIVLVLWLCLLVGETESLWQRSQALTARSTFSSSKALHRGYYHRRILQNRDIALTMGVDDNDEDDGFEGFEVVTPSKSSGASVVKPALSADQKKKFILATSAALLGIAYNVFQHTSEDGSSLALLKKMEVESVAFETALCNKKPTIIEFYADWCTSCKEIAPSMRAMEFKYRDKVNFITLNAMQPKNGIMVDAFKVDGIPHIAFLDPSNEVKTALVGAVPKQILDQEISSLVQDQDLPYEGFDSFKGKNHNPFDTNKICPLNTSS